MPFGDRGRLRTKLQRHTQTVIKIEIFPGVTKAQMKKLLYLSDVFRDIAKPPKPPVKKKRKRKCKR
jgi:hypothetical protein